MYKHESLPFTDYKYGQLLPIFSYLYQQLQIENKETISGYSPLNMHEHLLHLFWEDYWLYIRSNLTSSVNHHDTYIGFVVYTKKMI